MKFNKVRLFIKCSLALTMAMVSREVLFAQAISGMASVSQRAGAVSTTAGPQVNCNTLFQLPICPVPFEIEVAQLVNKIRMDSGKAPLIWDYRLFIGARCHCVDMNTNNCFQMNDCDGTAWPTKYQVQGYALVFAQDMAGAYLTPTAVVNAWLTATDSAHRHVMLNAPNKHIGVGYIDGIHGKFWTVAYGTQSTALALPCSCCYGPSGNIDCDVLDGTDISDLSALIDNLYISFTPLCCKGEANTDGDVTGNVDISDLSALIDFLYISFSPVAVCQ